MAKASPKQIASKRKEYAAVKRVYKSAGKKAFGKSKSSPAYREYRAAKKEYNTVGSQLGRMTGKKPRHGRR